jgi:hypothetical protein
MAIRENDALRQMILSAVEAIASADERNIRDAEGRILPMRQWPEREGRAIRQISVRPGPSGEPEIHSVSFASRAAAKRLLRRLGSGWNE